MPISYGSRIELPKLSSSEVGVFKSNRSHGIASLVDWLTTIGEFALMPFTGVIGSTLVGLAAASIRAATRKIVTGSLSVVSTAIDFAAALLPLTAGGKLYKEWKATKEYANYILGIEKSIIAKNHPLMRKMNPAKFSKLEKVTQELNLQSKISAFNRGISKSDPGKTISKLKALNENPKLKWAYSPFDNSAKSMEVIGRERDLHFKLQKAGFNVSETKELYKAFKNSQGNEEIMEKIFIKAKDMKLMDKAKKLALDSNNYQVQKLFNSSTMATKSERIKAPLLKEYIRILKNPGSRIFNEKIVQRVQAFFDAKDMGRAPAEAGYKWISKHVKETTKDLVKKIKGAKWGKKLAAMEKAFTKAGGVLCNSSVIMGYRILEKKVGMSLIQISFYPFMTKAKHEKWNGRRTKNFYGKKPVFVWATSTQIDSLRTKGMVYYLKKWARNRGGNHSSLFGINLLSGAEFILPFVNTGLLRNIFSLSSNIVHNTQSRLAGKGVYGIIDLFSPANSKKAWKGAFSSFKTVAMTRVGRIIGRRFIGGASSLIFGNVIGNAIGREAQRIMGGITASINKGFKAKKQSFHDAFVNQLKRELKSRPMKSSAAASRRKLKRKSGARIISSGRRKLGFIRRAPGSLIPGARKIVNVRK